MFPTQMDQASHSRRWQWWWTKIDNRNNMYSMKRTTAIEIRKWISNNCFQSRLFAARAHISLAFRVFASDIRALQLGEHQYNLSKNRILSLIFILLNLHIIISTETDTDDIEAQIATHFSMTLMKMEDVLQPFVQFVHAVCVLGVEWEKNAILRCCWTLNENFRTSDTRCRHSTCWSSPEMNFHFNSNIYFQ